MITVMAVSRSDDKVEAARPTIAYVVATFPGITETFILRELESLRERGFDLVVCAVRRPDQPEIERSLISEPVARNTLYARPDHVRRHFWANLRALCRSPGRYLASLRVFLAELPQLKPYDMGRVLYHFYCGIGFVDELRARGIRHLHAHFVTGSNIALAAHLYGGFSFSFTAHAAGDIYQNAILMGEKVKRAALVLPVCEYNRLYLDSLTGYRYGSKLCRLYNSVDTREVRSLMSPLTRAAHYEKESDRRRLLSVGSLLRMKGHATLIQACGLLKDRGYRLSCEIIGEGPERAVLERLIHEADLDEEIRLSGARPLRGVYTSMRCSEIFVLLSEIDIDGFRDGFPTVILEAMALELPVVSTWVSGIPEMVDHGKTGLLVPERDPEAAANAIARLFDDRDLRRTMGAAGRRKLDEEFNPRTTADLRARLFLEILAAGEV